jgi:hypothetical protein
MPHVPSCSQDMCMLAAFCFAVFGHLLATKWVVVRLHFVLPWSGDVRVRYALRTALFCGAEHEEFRLPFTFRTVLELETYVGMLFINLLFFNFHASTQAPMYTCFYVVTGRTNCETSLRMLAPVNRGPTP